MNNWDLIHDQGLRYFETNEGECKHCGSKTGLYIVMGGKPECNDCLSEEIENEGHLSDWERN